MMQTLSRNCQKSLLPDVSYQPSLGAAGAAAQRGPKRWSQVAQILRVAGVEGEPLTISPR